MALAARLRALPASDPSPALDERVLALARAAVSTPAGVRSTSRNKPGRRPRALWWLGTAASAVMAAGIGWQLVSPSQHDHLPPQTASPAARIAEPAGAKEDFEIVIVPRAPSAAGEAAAQRETSNRPSPASPPSIERMRAEQAQISRQAELSPLPEPPPERASRANLEETLPLPAAPPAPAGLAREPESAGSDAEIEDSQASLDQIVVTGSLWDGDLPPIAQDFRLTPADWLQRIRERRDRGDLDGAKRSLREYVRANPQRVVPKDLRRLLNEVP